MIFHFVLKLLGYQPNFDFIQQIAYVALNEVVYMKFCMNMEVSPVTYLDYVNYFVY